MKKIIKTIGLVAPSGYIKDIEELNSKIKILEKSFKVKKFYNEKTRLNYLSDTDENRTKYFTQAFLDNETDLIISVRGGYGAIRIVDLIDFDLIKNSNKIYCGSSDATILLCALLKYTNIQCFHSLMIANGFIENLENNINIIKNKSFDISYKTINKGVLKGKLWGGNLSSLVSILTCEKSFIPNDDIVLFIEDLNEPLYKIDKMLFQIYRNKKLREKIKGIIFGDFYLPKEEIFPLMKDFSNLFNVSAICTNQITHKKNNIVIPFAKEIEIIN